LVVRQSAEWSVGCHASPAQAVTYGVDADVEVVADRFEGQALFAESDGLEYLVVGEALAAHGHAVAVEVFADGLASDLELVSKVVDCAASPVTRYKLGHLIRRQPSLRLSPTWSQGAVAVSDSWSRIGGARDRGAKLG